MALKMTMSTSKSNDDGIQRVRRVVRVPSVRKLKVVDPPRISFDFTVPTDYLKRQSRSFVIRICTRALVEHVLYARGVVQVPTKDILHAYQQDVLVSSISAPRTERAVIKCGGLLHQLLLQWEEVMASDFADRIGAVLITLGQWWSRPREQYVVFFHGLGDDLHDESLSVEPHTSTEQQEHALSRRFISAILNSTNESQKNSDWMASPSLGASSYQVHISFWVPRSTADQFYENSRCATKFIARRGFYIQDQVSTGSKTAFIQSHVGVDGDKSLRNEWIETSGVWMSLPTTVKGFKDAGVSVPLP